MLQIILQEPGRFVGGTAPEPVRGPGEALVRVHRIGVCGTDLHAFAGRQPFFEYPRVLGHELGVEVVDPGDASAGLKPGDRCALEPYLNCGRCVACRRGRTNCCDHLRVLGVHVNGGMQPLLAVPATKLHRSAVLGYDELALVETLGIGAHAVERAAVSTDDFVLVIGAGPIGLGVIQFALLAGAQLAVLDLSEARLTFCREHLGVGNTLAPDEDLAAQLVAIGGRLPDVIFDATGNAKSMAGTFDLAAPGGRIVFVGLFQGNVTFNDPNFHRRELTLLATRNATADTFRRIIELAEAGKVTPRSWITHRLPLAEVPARFPREVAGDPGVRKAVIEVEGAPGPTR